RRLLRPHAQEAALGRPLRPRAPVVLTELRVRDLAVIADVTLPLSPGLNVLTGETGAGKSMLVDALALLLGERASSDVVRPGAHKAVIEAAFEGVPPLTDLGVEPEDGRRVLKRQLKARREEVQRKADYLRHVIQETERAQPRVGEQETLETEAKRLAHAEELVRLARELEEALDTAGLARAAKLVAGLERLDPAAGQWRQLLDGAFANVGELAQTARDYAAGIEADPRRLEDVEQRRDVLFSLTQKYGPTLPDVLATRDRTARELDLLDTADLD